MFQKQMEALHAINKAVNNYQDDKFAGLLVIPTGGGKTLTAVHWVLKNIINNNKSVLWIAHRYDLLDQALRTVKSNSYANLITKRECFNYRVISGQHCKPTEIRGDDDFIIASKDSLRKKDHLISMWLKSNKEVFLVIDETHRATAKSYRNIINLLGKEVDKLGILGSTATPFRTKVEEKGLLKKGFPNDIIYNINLRTLIREVYC
ncbi:DEAD/DEAH box helicase [Bacillus lacus]|uniref:DEAD/DEAH box helicase n=1 Tax=Metabacillus lacus TaxID=1983721 RepID=A0A7X2LZN6_9BACI|nr:DEAD/DEAH box helicase family protein [Metabacillus lacus]MRX72142.1 DEAD/DEAH box helicase [Metabacillus lacus]